jgi:hypothetical protein
MQQHATRTSIHHIQVLERHAAVRCAAAVLWESPSFGIQMSWSAMECQRHE